MRKNILHASVLACMLVSGTALAKSKVGAWVISDGARTQWKLHNISKVKVKDLRFGDFNGDKKTDVFRSGGGYWYVSWSGKSKWSRINKSKIKVSKLRVGDFNGDGKADIFRTDGKHWYVSWGGRSKWSQFNGCCAGCYSHFGGVRLRPSVAEGPATLPPKPRTLRSGEAYRPSPRGYSRRSP